MSWDDDDNVVECEVEDIRIESHGRMVDSVSAVCSRCENTTEAFGRGPASILRCLAKMRDECPRLESNFYVDADDPNR